MMTRGDRYPDHSGTITIEFVPPPDQPEAIEAKLTRAVNGSRA
jgi:hypothetical protein